MEKESGNDEKNKEKKEKSERDLSRRDFLRFGGIATLGEIIGTPPVKFDFKPKKIAVKKLKQRKIKKMLRKKNND